MDELSETLRGLLDDPAQLSALREMAQGLLAGDGLRDLTGLLGGGAASETDGNAPREAPPTGGEELRKTLGALLGGNAPPVPPPGGPPESGNKAELLQALGPWLKPERRARLQRALRLARAARLAAATLRRFGEDAHVSPL